MSADDVRARLADEADPAVRGAARRCCWPPTSWGASTVEFEIVETSDGTIAYDQVYALGVHQGAFDGLPDPAVPASAA